MGLMLKGDSRLASSHLVIYVSLFQPETVVSKKFHQTTAVLTKFAADWNKDTRWNGLITSACTPSNTAPRPVTPTHSPSRERTWSLLPPVRGNTTEARKDVVPRLGNTRCEYSESRCNGKEISLYFQSLNVACNTKSKTQETSVLRTLCYVPDTLYLYRGHLSIQGTLPGPQGVYNRGAPLYLQAM